MNRVNQVTFPLLFFVLFSFSSCVHQPPMTDAGTDEALGLGVQSDAGSAQQELNKIQEAQREEQRRRLERQITETVPPTPTAQQ